MNRSRSAMSALCRYYLVAFWGLCVFVAAPAAAQQPLVVTGEEARRHARDLGLPIRLETAHEVIELQAFVRGRPLYYITDNAVAADSISTDECLPGGSSGLGLTGSGVTLGIWDGGGVRTTHREFSGRAVQIDAPAGTHYHATHVGGTMIGVGVDAAAKGMSPAALLNCWDWNDDTTEMVAAAAGGLRASNHSYSYITGWYYSSGAGAWYWYGDVTVSPTEDNAFGLYAGYTQELDQIAYDHPYYLSCRSAGNDRDDDGPGPGGGHYYWDPSEGWTWSTDTRDPDGLWDCIGTTAIAKNVLTVAAVDDVPGGYSGPGSVAMAYFSSWGPTDDGRIKPDISGNGIGLYSCLDSSDSAYASLSGTSMSSPNVTGSLGVLIQHWRGTHPTEGDMRAATLKGLVLHTADEAGSAAGPDYAYGWGLMNTLRAAQTISADVSAPLMISERTLANGQTFELYATTDGSAGELRASICWTDPPGTPPGNLLNPTTPMLVNDLDLRIVRALPAATYYPWVLDPASPGNPASTGDNFRDNVEQVVVGVPGTNDYIIRVTHKGSLSSGSQAYALIVTGAASLSTSPPQFTLTVNVTGQGGVDLLPPGGTYATGTPVQLTAVPDPGWAFEHWTGALSGALNPETLVMDDDKTVTAVFVIDCNGNGVDDALDIANATSEDCNGNLVPDECEMDSDHDGVIDDCDGCPADPDKVEPGICGCGVPDTDSDDDGTPDCNDNCPLDPNKIEPGICGCGVSDTDSDNDGTPDCNDNCPLDPNKVEPGICGCGVPDVDSDGDGVYDCNDLCPGTPPGTPVNADGCPDCNGNGIDDAIDIANCAGDPACADCNANGIPDGCDISGGTSVDADGDGILDECEVCPGDLNCDGQVDFRDINPFVLYLSSFSTWQSTYSGCEPRNGDIDSDDTYPSFSDINPFVTLLSTATLPVICP